MIPACLRSRLPARSALIAALWLPALPACRAPDSPPGADDTGTGATGSADLPLPGAAAPVVIIGAGPAGLAAALDLPGSVVLEADAEVGGRFRWAGGLLLAVGTEEQAAAGISDSVDLAVAEWPELTGGAATDQTRRFLGDSDAVHDRLSALGVRWSVELAPEAWWGTPRLHEPEGGGAAVIAALVAALPETAEVRLQTEALGLLVRGGRVAGVQTANGVIAARAVIIATGGFVGRSDWMEPIVAAAGYGEGSWVGAIEGGASGFARDQADLHALDTDRLEDIGWYRRSIAAPGGDGHPIPLDPRAGAFWILVDDGGARFVDELQVGSVRTHGVIEAAGGGWAVVPRAILDDTLPDGMVELASARPDLFRCGDAVAAGADNTESAAALAAALGIDPDGLLQTLADAEAYRLGAEDPLGRPSMSFPDLTGTLCAFRPGYEAAKNFGGLVVDADGAVPGIGGLWAVGEAAGMAAPGIGGAWGFDGSSGAVIWSGWRTAAALRSRLEAEDE